jgi:hypothetical protein
LELDCQVLADHATPNFKVALNSLRYDLSTILRLFSVGFDLGIINFASAILSYFLIKFGLVLTTWRGLEILIFYAKTLISVFKSTAIIKPLFLFYDSRLYILAKDSV